MKNTLERQKVLIVDDMPTNIKILSDALRDTYRLSAAVRGAEALEIAASDDPPDVILLDIMMPEMDGYEVLSRLKRNTRTMNIPVIFVTAKSQLDDEIRGLALGAVDYITKPFYVPIVKARLKTHMELKRKSDLLERLALMDGLTNIPNRRKFDLHLTQEMRRLARSKRPISLVMIDIDHFKGFNDSLGHGAGDECLRQVARALDMSLKRPGDLVARYGGEEFSAVLPETDMDGALALAESMRQAVEDLGVRHVASPVSEYVTVSLGAASMTPGPETEPGQLVSAADGQLYESKQNGRNRVSGKRISPG
ncbi:MAG: diguanylate cyclase domain-containing protein [Desulfovibrionaceae bacterium]